MNVNSNVQAVFIEAPKKNEKPPHRWLGSIELDFDHDNERTFLTEKHHRGPLVVQKTLYPEGKAVCHGIILHPPGGVAGGDRLLIEARLRPKAHTLLTTPGAGKWYKANQLRATQIVTFDIANDACMEWFPQENILFNGSQVELKTDIHLGTGSVYAGWDILCLGRQAKGETWEEGALWQSLKIRRLGKLIWNEQACLNPGSRLMQSKTGLRGNAVSGSFVIAGDKVPSDILESCRAVEAGDDARYGLTAMNNIVAARYIGQSSQQARCYFETLWEILRPWYGQRASRRPRIWNT